MDSGDNDLELTSEINAKYLVNAGAFRKGITPEENANYYTKWAENKQYEKVRYILKSK